MIEKTAGRLLRSAGAASISQVWRMVVTFATMMALRRLIPPDQWGVWTWAEPLFLILAQVRDLGLPAHVVRDRSRPYGNFLAVELAWGGPLTLAVLVAAPLLALAYADQDTNVILVMRALCIFLFVHGLGLVPMTFFEAEIMVEKTIPAEIVRNVSFAIIALVLAFDGHGVWSIIVAHIAGATIYSVMLWWKAWPLMNLHWVRGATLRLIRLSCPLAVMSIFEQLVLKLDAFVLGLRFDTEVVGTAGLAMYAVFFFSRLLADSVGRALYPALVAYSAAPRRAFEAFRVATLFMLVFAVPTACFLFINAELAATFLGGKKWVGASDYLRLASLVPLARPLNMFGMELMLISHRDRLLIGYTLLNLLSLGGLGLYLTTTELGPLGMAIAGYFPLGSLLLAWGVRRVCPPAFALLLRHIAEMYAVFLLLFFPALLVPATGVWPRLAISCLAGLLGVGYCYWRFGRSFMRFLTDRVEEAEE